MFVIKRNGDQVPVSFDEVLQRIRKLSEGLEHVNPDLVAQKVCNQLVDGMQTSKLDEFAGETCAMMQARYHPNYGKLASRIVIDNHQKITPQTLIDCVEKLYHGSIQLVTDEYHDLACKHKNQYESMIDYSRDYMFDYFGFKTLERGYLLRVDGHVVERPQHMWMRVAIQLHGANFVRVKETYDALSEGYFIHATPTLYNSGTVTPQLSSCFLLQMSDDSIKGIYKTLGDCAQISKWAGGIGLSIHNIRARSSRIRGTNGESTGIVPMLKVFNDTAKYVNQGGKRNGSFAIYLEPWHADIEDFLRLKLNQGAEEDRARDLFYGLWIPDEFMRRVEANTEWTLMCPNECPGLDNVWGEKFDELYRKYESEGRGRKTIPAQKIWQMILDCQIQTGNPYLCYKDAANAKSNQQNLGTIKSSNLCVAPETLVLTDQGVYQMISKLENKTIKVWNGNELSEVKVIKTGTNQKLLRVNVGGNILYCTEYHKFILPTSPTIANCERIEARELKQGMILQGYYSINKSWVSQKVVSVEFDGRYDDTYCFNEPLNHAGVFNGILTGNCTEIMEFTSPEETAVCNLGSLALPKFVEDGVFNFGKLRAYTQILARNLDIVIDKNFYPTPETRASNARNRPIGIGVQGLADVFALMRLPWSSEAAQQLNATIFEHIYYAACQASIETAAQNTVEGYWRGMPVIEKAGYYPSYHGSPTSHGNFQFDLWNVQPSSILDWNRLRQEMQRFGIRNSLLVAPMPTASTSQILGNNECFEPFTSNLYTRRVLAGDFMVVNKYLVEDLIKLRLWNSWTREQIMAHNGSIQNIEEIPDDLKELYKTAWEIPQKTLINMSRDRAPFICQSQSLNLFLTEPTYAKISSMHIYAWKQGLKTGCYYLRTKAASSAQKFTVEPCQSCSA
uniref:ribonucleoside-diphosphate reductase n=1 Tax=viral metagenome TaxID=1070528 RepID=A0A6C0KC27_9ZZZZ